MKKSVLSSWSGGKDSCFACYEAMQKGYEVSYLVNFISEEYKRVRFHGTEAKLIKLQAEAIGIRLLQKETTADGYERQFKDAVRGLTQSGINGMVFGDIYLQEHRDWVESVCGELNIEAIEPLWERRPEDILRDFIDKDFEAILISAKLDLFGEEWIGRRIDKEFLRFLKEKNIDVCGENGEYHTLVTNGPIFKKRIKINSSVPIVRDNHRFLDILEYSLEDPG